MNLPDAPIADEGVNAASRFRHANSGSRVRALRGVV